MNRRRLNPILVGAVGGLAWSASLRGFMVEIAGSESQFRWLRTFGGILIPSTVAGGLIGWAEVRRRAGRPVRAVILAPLLPSVVTLAMPGQLASVVTTGQGTAGPAVALIGMAGGYALSPGGRVWARVACGTVALSIVPLWAAFSTQIGETPAVTTPRGAWTAVLFWSLLAVLAFACTVPLRRADAAPSGLTGTSARAQLPARLRERSD
ncbi:hypothetical protein [Mycetocola sp. 2940]|uniref:hypothetical protein n=1 Tax=Mycetocola sp. 2940 TaxID=3156452 RepID=UPI003390E345